MILLKVNHEIIVETIFSFSFTFLIIFELDPVFFLTNAQFLEQINQLKNYYLINAPLEASMEPMELC